jgi:hypothetical protein
MTSLQMPSDLLRFLGDPASYPHAPAAVRIVQTHISVVAIASPYVFKVKKPVDFGFLDFSSIDRRRHYCEEEVRLNRRLCARIYEGVVPIGRRNGVLIWGEGDEIVDYAVRMIELDEHGFLHSRLANGSLDAALLDRIVEVLAAFYRGQSPSPVTAAWGRSEALRINTDENFTQTERFIGRLIAPPTYAAIRYAVDRFFNTHTAFLESRRAAGRVVDGHGDLRLEHIHAGPEGMCIYDAVEFSERLRAVDVANDLAFLVMDLDFHGRHDLARYFAAAMIRALDDPGMADVLDFYAGYRAYVRAKVESLRGDEVEVPDDERESSRERAKRYYQLALRYAVFGAMPAVVAVMGRVGTGKSTLAHALGEASGWEVLSSDRIRKSAAGLPLNERTHPTDRTWLYARDRTESVYRTLREGAIDRARRGLGTVLDATFGRRDDRAALRDALRAADTPLFFVETLAPNDVIRNRLRARAVEPGVISDARLEDFETLAGRYEAPDALEDPCHFSVEATGDRDRTIEAVWRSLILRREG